MLAMMLAMSEGTEINLNFSQSLKCRGIDGVVKERTQQLSPKQFFLVLLRPIFKLSRIFLVRTDWVLRLDTSSTFTHQRVEEIYKLIGRILSTK